jgi:hypothetical protein
MFLILFVENDLNHAWRSAACRKVIAVSLCVSFVTLCVLRG